MFRFILTIATIAVPKYRAARLDDSAARMEIAAIATTSGRETGPEEAAYRINDRMKYPATNASRIPSERFSKKMFRLIVAVLVGIVFSDSFLFLLDLLFRHLFNSSISHHVRIAVGILSSSIATGGMAWFTGGSSDDPRNAAQLGPSVNAPESR